MKLEDLLPNAAVRGITPGALASVVSVQWHGSDAHFRVVSEAERIRLAEQSHPTFPVTTYYAFEQAENETDEGTASTGWETFLDEALAEQEGDFDADSRWALTWFEQSGFAEGEYGVAEQLSKSKNTSVAGMALADILESKRGKVRLLRPGELPAEWDPATEPRLTAREIVHHLVRVSDPHRGGGEGAATALVGKLGAKAEVARELASRLYTLCERKKRAAEALSYNALVQSWPEITRLTREPAADAAPAQGGLFDEAGG